MIKFLLKHVSNTEILSVLTHVRSTERKNAQKVMFLSVNTRFLNSCRFERRVFHQRRHKSNDFFKYNFKLIYLICILLEKAYKLVLYAAFWQIVYLRKLHWRISVDVRTLLESCLKFITLNMLSNSTSNINGKWS